MLRLYACVVGQHDLRLVALAAAICVLSCYAAVDLLGRARQSLGERRSTWARAGAAVFGAGVWATHFLAELAYNPGLPLGYDIGLTALSLVLAMSLAWLGLTVALRYAAPLSGGGILGAAVGAMHYTGMSALRLPAVVHWDPAYVLASLAVGIALCAAALRVTCAAPALHRHVLAATLLVGAICGLHFIGMTAVTLEPDPRIVVSDAMVRSGTLIVAVAVVSLLIIALALLGLVADARLARQAAREAARLQASEALLQDAIEAFPEGFVLYDAAGRFVLCNSRYRALYAETAELLHPGARFEDVLRGSAERGQFAFGGASREAWVEDRLQRWQHPGPAFEQRLATGEWVRVIDRRTSAGGMIGVRVDITELKQREASFRVLFDANPLAMMVYDQATQRFLEVNDAAVIHYGYTREQFLALTTGQLQAAQETASPPPAVARHRKADGTVILAEVTTHSLRFQGRTAALMVAVDVTERRRTEAALRDSEARLRHSERHLARAQEVAEIGSFESDLDGKAVWSDNLYRIYGVDKESFIASFENLLNFVHPEDRERFVAARESLRAGRSQDSFAFRIVRADGACRHLLREVELIHAEDGTLCGVFGTIRDVTAATEMEEQRRVLEAQLHHSQRLEALGTLAGGVAHDLNNTLVPVLGLAKLTMKRLPGGSRERANLATILKAGERARDLVRQILAFSRKEAPTRQIVDIAAQLRDWLSMLSSSLPATIRLEEAIEEVPLLSADPGQLHQVMLNLVVNAGQAIGDKMGRITVTLGAADHPLPDEHGRDAVVPAIHLAVQDTGCGMDEATRQRIFEPFFTTKPVGEGTGLGLSVVHGIIAQHGGRISVESRPGEGTRFDIWLPALSREEEARQLECAVLAV